MTDKESELREILEKNLGQKIPEGQSGSGDVFFIGTEPFVNQEGIDQALAQIEVLLCDKCKEKIRKIICDIIHESNGLEKVKPCKDSFGYVCSYKILCNNAIFQAKEIIKIKEV